MEQIPEVIKQYKEKVQVRTMNEDNPQYVLGWNACRYLSEKFILFYNEELKQQILKRIHLEWRVPMTEKDILEIINFTLSE